MYAPRGPCERVHTFGSDSAKLLSNCPEGSYREPGQTSQLRILASILAQSYFPESSNVYTEGPPKFMPEVRPQVADSGGHLLSWNDVGFSIRSCATAAAGAAVRPNSRQWQAETRSAGRSRRTR